MKKKLSSRDEQILLLLKRFDFLTRDQLSTYFNLGKKRNTNRILNNLSNHLSSVADGRHETVYYLNNLGRSYVNCPKVRRKTNQVQHTVMRNQFWLFYESPNDWKNEIKVSDGKTTVVVDSMFTKNYRSHFLEVDHLQPMKENRTKVARYIELLNNGLIAKSLGHFPTLVWLTTTELRRSQLQELCKGLPNCKVYTLDDIK